MKNVWHYDCPIGTVWIAEENEAISHLVFNKNDISIEDFNDKETPLIKKTSMQLAEYFDGKRKTFDLPLILKGTEFQKKVWEALLTIPAGETRSYKEIAEQIGNPKAARAIGMANNRNPIAIIVPCHRVIGHNGDLVGYGGGISIKQYLLGLEKPIPNSKYFEYGEKEIDYLKSRDPVLGAAIDEIGHINRPVIPDMFMALINSIVGQQISTTAQKTIWKRMQDQFSPLTPETIGATPVDKLQSCGISMRKASYIKEIANSILDGSLNLVQLQSMSDDEVCTRLSQIKGVGTWTAEMLMTFSMQRPNIISWGDLAILRGLRMLYGHHEITPKLFAKYKRRYSPYATVASLYLWAIAGGACSDLVDPGA